jgi:hypothetical protein
VYLFRLVVKLPRTRPPAWLAAILVASAILAGWDLWTWLSTELARPYLNDFRGYYAAAQIGVRGGWSRIYDLRLQAAAGEAIAGVRGNWVPFVNPPPMAWIMAPLTLLPFAVAYWLWDAILLGGVVASWRLVVTGDGWRRAATLLATLAVLPVTFAFMLGTSGLLNAIAVPVAWWLLKRRKDAGAGLVLAAAIAAKPQDAFLLPLALLIAGRVRAFVAAAAGLAVLAAASLLTLGGSGLRTMIATLVGTEAQLLEVNHRFTVIGVFGDHPATYVIQAVLALAALATARRRRSRLELVMAGGVLASFFLAPHLSLQDYSVLATTSWLLLRLRLRPPLIALFGFGYLAAEFAVPLGMLPLFLFELGLLVALALPAGFEDDEDRRAEQDDPERRKDAAHHGQHHLE